MTYRHISINKKICHSKQNEVHMGSPQSILFVGIRKQRKFRQGSN